MLSGVYWCGLTGIGMCLTPCMTIELWYQSSMLLFKNYNKQVEKNKYDI